MNDCIKIGVLGCGQIAQIMHLPYLSDLEGLTIHALCDISRETLCKVGKKYDIPPERQYTDYDLFLQDHELDAVLICSKDHCEAVVKAARAKKHVFVEKPFGFNLQEAQSMVDAAEQNDVKLMVGYMKRYDHGYEELLRQIKQIQGISMVRVHDFGGSFAYTKQVFDVSGGTDVPAQILAAGKETTNRAMLQEIGEENADLLPAYSLLLGVSSHDSVLLRHAFGSHPQVLYATAYQDGFLTALLRYGDIVCIFESGLVMDRYIWDETFSVYSGEKNITLQFPWPYLKNAPSTLKISDCVPDTQMPRESVVTASFHEAYRNEWLHFRDCIRTNTQPLTSGQDALEDIRLMSEIIHMAQKSRQTNSAHE